MPWINPEFEAFRKVTLIFILKWQGSETPGASLAKLCYLLHFGLIDFGFFFAISVHDEGSMFLLPSACLFYGASGCWSGPSAQLMFHLQGLRERAQVSSKTWCHFLLRQLRVAYSINGPPLAVPTRNISAVGVNRRTMSRTWLLSPSLGLEAFQLWICGARTLWTKTHGLGQKKLRPEEAASLPGPTPHPKGNLHGI